MALNEYLNKKICAITIDGRMLVGTLEAVDHVTNLVMSGTEERMVKPRADEGESAVEPVGLYLLRGDNVVCVGPVDEELDKSIDWTKVRGEKIRDTKNT